jgi:hypothetical protein
VSWGEEMTLEVFNHRAKAGRKGGNYGVGRKGHWGLKGPLVQGVYHFLVASDQRRDYPEEAWSAEHGTEELKPLLFCLEPQRGEQGLIEGTMIFSPCLE